MRVATVLVAEGDERVLRIARAGLERAGLTVCEARDGRAALDRLRAGGVDVLALGLALPGASGWAVLRELRQFAEIPVLLLIPGGEESGRRQGFELGADDFVVRPFSPREVAARVVALLRRGQPPETLCIGVLRFEAGARSVHVGDAPVDLTPREYELLEFLARHPGQVFSRQDLLDRVWGSDFPGGPRTVDTHIRKLRDKLGPAAEPIRTVWGSGYKLEVV